MSTGLLGVMIIFGVIIMAVVTKKCLESIFLGTIVASIVLYQGAFFTEWVTLFQTEFCDPTLCWLVVIITSFNGLIALLQVSRGTLGFSKIIADKCNTERKTLLMTFVLGVLIFIDDYLNVLSIGACMKPVYDERKLPRETLAYMLDSTGAPVCCLIPLSTWGVFLGSVFALEESVAALGYSSDIALYAAAVPFSLYPIFALIVVLLFTFGVIPKIGTMKDAYTRVETTGKVYSDASKKYNHTENEEDIVPGNMWDFLVPMLVMIAVAVVTNDIVLGVFLAIVSCFIMMVPRKIISVSEFFPIILKGAAEMVPMVLLFVFAFMITELMGEMGMTEYIIENTQVALIALGSSLFPVIVFVLVSFLTFTTGTLWPMCVLVIPILIPLNAAVGANTLLTMGAIISGVSLGSHACFYTDATMLSAQSAGIETLDHSLSQIPYVVIAFILSAIGYVVLGYML